MTQEKVRVYQLAVLCSSVLLFSGALLAQKTDKDCQCRAPGGDMKDLGTVECIQIGGTTKLVTCTMSTNTPYWKDVENVEGCPSA